jgi:hypothetical protein
MINQQAFFICFARVEWLVYIFDKKPYLFIPIINNAENLFLHNIINVGKRYIAEERRDGSKYPTGMRNECRGVLRTARTNVEH